MLIHNDMNDSKRLSCDMGKVYKDWFGIVFSLSVFMISGHVCVPAGECGLVFID